MKNLKKFMGEKIGSVKRDQEFSIIWRVNNMFGDDDYFDDEDY